MRTRPFLLLSALTWPCAGLGSGLPAFAGAEGFGAHTRHARGTEVCRVTTLDDAARGTRIHELPRGGFRYCLARAAEFGGAYILFGVSGTIYLTRPAVVPSNVYIAGQTSPGGVAFEGHPIVVKDARDVVIRHVRHREAIRKGDAFRIENSGNVVIDHVSVSFFKDGAVDIVGNARDVTISWSHMGDSMDSGAPNERYHGQPNLLRTGVDRVSLHHNFYTHGHTRMPLVTHTVAAPGFLIDFTNNVIYNYGKYPSRFAAHYGRGNVVGNFYIPGRNTHSDDAPTGTSDKLAEARASDTVDHRLKPPVLVENRMSLYVRDNVMIDGLGHDASIFTDRFGKQIELGRPGPVTGVRPDDSTPDARIVRSGPGKIVREAVPFAALPKRVAAIPPVTVYPARENVAIVMRSFGALPRDNTDRRLVEELRTRTGRWKYLRPDDGNVYAGTAPADGDGDGLPDTFEARFTGDLAPIGHDASPDRDNVEVYLDELAARLLEGTRAPEIPL